MSGSVDINEMQYDEDDDITYQVNGTGSAEGVFDDEEFTELVDAESFAEEWQGQCELEGIETPLITRNYTKPSWARK